MKRFLFRSSLLALAVVLSGSIVQAQDKVIFRDSSTKEKKVIEQPGTLQSESLNNVVIKPNIGAAKTILAMDIVDIVYDAKAPWKTEYNKAVASERVTAEKSKVNTAPWRAAMSSALQDYQAALPKTTATAAVQRHVEYKIAMISAMVAGDDKTEMKKAADLLAAYKTKHGNNWQIFSCMARLSKVYEDLGDLEKAAALFDDLRKSPGLSDDAKAELELKSVDYLLRAKKHTEAEGRLSKILATMDKKNPRYDELNMQLIICKASTPPKYKEAVDDLQKMTKNEKDPARKALAFNTLGDIYMTNNQPKEAVYEFLYVDLIYFQDKSQHLRAVEKLVTVFRELKQMDRSKEYADKLERLKK